MQQLRVWQRLSVAQKIVLSFVGVILVGSALLSAPFSLQIGQQISYIDALFVAVSATCVTGLTPVVISEVFNPFGQFVILTMIQIGGVGLVTLIGYTVLVLTNRLGISNQLLVKDMLNKDGLFQFKPFLKRLMKYVVTIESVGAILLYVFLVKEYGVLNGAWHAIFLSISAFCNAGFDLIGAKSLTPFVSHLPIQTIIMTLILLGGLGYLVWFDLAAFMKRLYQQKSLHRAKQSFSIQSKIVLKVNVFLIVIPSLILLGTMVSSESFQQLTFLEKIYAALFQIVTLRTAGFYTVDFSVFNNLTIWMMLPIMFIGGSSGGTAGGIKTTTAYVVYRYMMTLFKGEKAIILQHRRVSQETIAKALLILVATVMAWFVAISLIGLDVPKGRFLDHIFEATSAISTTGISTGITANLPMLSKSILMVLMFIGRLGIVTFVMSMRQVNEDRKVRYPVEKIVVG